MSISQNQQKNWWAPVWTGLILDRSAKHYRNIKSGLWLFLYFLLCADRRTGLLKRKIKTICSETGFTRNLTLRWLKNLREHGYIETSNTGRALSIQIKKWKPLKEVTEMQHQKYQNGDFRSIKNETSHGGLNCQNIFRLGHEMNNLPEANETTIKKDILTNYIDRNLNFSIDGSSKGKDKGNSYALAGEISQALNDRKGFPFYLSCANKYPEALIKKVLNKVQTIPIQKIKKSRGALFNYLIQKHA